MCTGTEQGVARYKKILYLYFIIAVELAQLFYNSERFTHSDQRSKDK